MGRDLIGAYLVAKTCADGAENSAVVTGEAGAWRKWAKDEISWWRKWQEFRREKCKSRAPEAG